MEEGPGEYQTIPLEKIEDFGVHCKQYYSLDVSYFKSSLDSHLLDLLWNKYWVNTLSSCSLITVSHMIQSRHVIRSCDMEANCVYLGPVPILQNADYTTQQIADLSQKLERAEYQVLINITHAHTHTLAIIGSSLRQPGCSQTLHLGTLSKPEL